MKITIPQNTILKPSGLGDILGDFVESFNLDLSSNYGVIKTTRMKEIISSDDDSFVENAVCMAYYQNYYYFGTDDYVYRSDSFNLNSGFSRVTATNSPGSSGVGELSEAFSDMELFNDCLYVSGDDSLFKLDGGNWSEAVTSGISNSPHLLKAFSNRLYLTEGRTKVLSISSSDAIATSGQYTLDLGVTDEYSISALEAGSNNLWIGTLNVDNSRGVLFTWNGSTTNTPTDRIELDAGVIAGTTLNNVFYYVDASGRLMTASSTGIKEVARFFKKTEYRFNGADGGNNVRFVHANGMTSTDRGTILISFSNFLRNDITNENTIPSGIWEYDPNIGLYHKYSFSTSRADSTNSTTITDYGQQKLSTQVGAILYAPSTAQSATSNGSLMSGARIYTGSGGSDVKYAVFCDDTLDTTQKFAYFVTNKKQSLLVNESWHELYVMFEKFLDINDKIIPKYRTRFEKETDIDITWTSTSSFTTTDNISAYAVGDEYQCSYGPGAGKNAHISQISESGGTYTVTLDDTFTGVTGTASGYLSKWIKLGEITKDNHEQWKGFTIHSQMKSPFIQFKVSMQFTGENKVHKLLVTSDTDVKA